MTFRRGPGARTQTGDRVSSSGACRISQDPFSGGAGTHLPSPRKIRKRADLAAPPKFERATSRRNLISVYASWRSREALRLLSRRISQKELGKGCSKGSFTESPVPFVSECLSVSLFHGVFEIQVVARWRFNRLEFLAILPLLPSIAFFTMFRDRWIRRKLFLDTKGFYFRTWSWNLKSRVFYVSPGPSSSSFLISYLQTESVSNNFFNIVPLQLCMLSPCSSFFPCICFVIPAASLCVNWSISGRHVQGPQLFITVVHYRDAIFFCRFNWTHRCEVWKSKWYRLLRTDGEEVAVADSSSHSLFAVISSDDSEFM